MDADDFAYPLRLETQLQLLHEQNLDVIGCQVRILNETGRVARSMGRYQRWINEVLFDWTDHVDRLTRTDSRYTLEAFTRCRQLHLLAGPLRNATCVDLWGVGQAGKPWLRWFQAWNVTVRRGYDINERKVNKRIHGVQIEHPSEMPVADGTPLVIAVGAEGARELILPQIRSRGYVSGDDAWFVT